MKFNEIVAFLLEKSSNKHKRKRKKAKEENVEQYDHAVTLEHAHKQKRST